MKKARRKKKLGFTNKFAMFLGSLIAFGLVGGFYLAVMSIKYNYLGSLLCYTCVFTPIGTALALVLGKVVDKNKAENTSSDGTGIVYAKAMASGFKDSPQL